MEGDIVFSENSNTDSVIQKKRRSFRKSALIVPLLAILAGYFYLDYNTIYIFWHPVLNSLTKIIYFLYFIASDEITANKGFSAAIMADLLLIGISILMALFLLYFFTKNIIDVLEKKNIRFAAILGNVFACIVLLLLSFSFTAIGVNRCISEKNNNIRWPERKGLLQLSFSNESVSGFNELKGGMDLFYRLNGIEYLHDGLSSSSMVVKTAMGKEVETACRLEAYHRRISSAWPFSASKYFRLPDWKEKRDLTCRAYGFDEKNIKQCVEFILKDSDVLKKSDFNYEITEEGEVKFTSRK